LSHATTDLTTSGPFPTRFALERDRAVLLAVDVQVSAAARLPPAAWTRVVRNTGILLAAAQELGLLVLATELAPERRGPTSSELAARLPAGTAPVARQAYSCGAAKELARALYHSGRKQVVVAGLETHAAVFQTVRDLVAGGYAPFVPGDACAARHADDHDAALALMRDCGATITTTEAIVHDLLGAVDTPEYERIAPLLR
jgi:nicotinamidase-related amidase